MWVLFKDRNTTSCQLVLNCSVEADNMIVSWYRDEVKLKESSGSSAQVVQSVLANSSHVYSCNVSATHSWAHRSFSLTPGCAVSVGECVSGCVGRCGSVWVCGSVVCGVCGVWGCGGVCELVRLASGYVVLLYSPSGAWVDGEAFLSPGQNLQPLLPCGSVGLRVTLRK